ncbi:TetR/AcrR family transcriptional regulator [uncultured Dokdonia sp.]|uniref:TetR/AcrR family transcriptional regulator n=1 Tax=uncultured Dokdonia sp. TaxID=575653 RepID=UPI002636A177|nr:TetR/AcrR family transcriptional regulator [uncultured Dokdonia sp.]
MKLNTLSRKQEIYRTAAKLFKEKGYSAVTMRDLAAAVGIKAASLYNHITSKQQILSEIILDIAEQFTEGIDAIVDRDTDTITKLKEVIAQHIILTTDNPYGMAALNNDWMHLEGKLDHYLDLRTRYENKFRSIVLEGKESGELKDVNTEILLYSILTTLRNLYLWIPKKGELQKDVLIKELSVTLLQGVEK